MKKQTPSIKVQPEVKKKLDEFKVSPSESYSDVIMRLFKEVGK